MASNFNEEETQDEIDEIISNPEYQKSQTLVDIANNTFKELCKTLENEQIKLFELEERRKKLQEEMQRLKQEIEDEKESYRLNMVDSLTDNLGELSASTDSESVHEFIERQKAALQKLHSDTSSLQLDTESSANLIALNTINETVNDLDVVEKESMECTKET